MEELEAIREAEEAALKSAEQAAEEAALAAMNLDIIDEEDLMKPGKDNFEKGYSRMYNGEQSKPPLWPFMK